MPEALRLLRCTLILIHFKPPTIIGGCRVILAIRSGKSCALNLDTLVVAIAEGHMAWPSFRLQVGHEGQRCLLIVLVMAATAYVTANASARNTAGQQAASIRHGRACEAAAHARRGRGSQNLGCPNAKTQQAVQAVYGLRALAVLRSAGSRAPTSPPRPNSFPVYRPNLEGLQKMAQRRSPRPPSI